MNVVLLADYSWRGCCRCNSRFWIVDAASVSVADVAIATVATTTSTATAATTKTKTTAAAISTAPVAHENAGRIVYSSLFVIAAVVVVGGGGDHLEWDRIGREGLLYDEVRFLEIYIHNKCRITSALVVGGNGRLVSKHNITIPYFRRFRCRKSA